MEITLKNREKILSLLKEGVCPICGRAGLKIPLIHITRMHNINRIEFKNLITLGQRNGFLDQEYLKRKLEYAKNKQILSRFKNKPQKKEKSDTAKKAISYLAKQRYASGKIKLNKGNPDINSIIKAQSKPIVCIDSNGNEKQYANITEAAKEHGITIQAISKCLNGRSKTSAGYKWKYQNRED